jgi:hypothetical protein
MQNECIKKKYKQQTNTNHKTKYNKIHLHVGAQLLHLVVGGYYLNLHNVGVHAIGSVH